MAEGSAGLAFLDKTKDDKNKNSAALSLQNLAGSKWNNHTAGQNFTPNSVVIQGTKANKEANDAIAAAQEAAQAAQEAQQDVYDAPNYYPGYGAGVITGTASNPDEPTEKQKKAAQNQKDLAAFEAQNTRDQLADRFNYFDQSNKNLRDYADAQRVQNERKTSSERFNAQRDMLDSLFALRNHMGQALNGSASYGLMDMARNRNDLTNTKYWETLIDNQNAVENSYTQAYNQNQLAKLDAQIDARKDLADREANLAANLNNIDPSFFELPGENSSINLLGRNSSGVPESTLTEQYARESGYASSGYGLPDRQVTGADPLNLNVELRQATWEPYVMSDKERARIQPSRLRSDDYFSRLINNYNGYRS